MPMNIDEFSVLSHVTEKLCHISTCSLQIKEKFFQLASRIFFFPFTCIFTEQKKLILYFYCKKNVLYMYMYKIYILWNKGCWNLCFQLVITREEIIVKARLSNLVVTPVTSAHAQ